MVLNDEGIFREGIKLQAVGLVAAVAAATLFALFVQTTYLVPPGTDVFSISEISSRVSPDLLSLVIEIGTGVAGAWSLTAGSSELLVGVMVAAALVPPLGVVGIGIAYGLPIVALSASVSVLVNVFAINLAGLGVFWYKGYRPANWYQEDEASVETRRQIHVFIVLILVLSGFLGMVSYDAYRTAQFEQDLRSDIPAPSTPQSARTSNCLTSKCDTTIRHRSSSPSVSSSLLAFHQGKNRRTSLSRSNNRQISDSVRGLL